MAIELTLASHESDSVKIIGSLYEKRAFAFMRIGNKASALIDGKMLNFLNHKNIIGWACLACCATNNTDYLIAITTFKCLTNKINKLNNEIKCGIKSHNYYQARF